MRLLVVEDNAKLSELLAQGLSRAGFESDRVSHLAAAEEALVASRYAAMILDLGLPDGDGRSLVTSLRARGDAIPVLLLTARDGLDDKVAGLASGADDYLVKPFAFEELIARLRALLRRPGEFLGDSLSAGNVTFDTVARQVFVGGSPANFSAREMALLEILIRRPGRVIPKRMVEDHLFGLTDEIRSNAVEVNVHRLRRQLSETGADVEVHTVRGVGYILMEPKN
ncbi:MAG TPA: response regulator transcription factor [Rhizomicrobium sp.]|nr:response regulator transcription factor [Rhizomicrobium sp.]